jgi:hypothetical protein
MSRRFTAELRDGIVVVFSDAHYWPGPATIAHKALLAVIQNLKPAIVIANGDVFDGSRVSRHDALYKQECPSPKEEVEACVERMTEIEDASKNSTFIVDGRQPRPKTCGDTSELTPQKSLGCPSQTCLNTLAGGSQTYAIDVNGNYFNQASLAQRNTRNL